MLQDPNFTTVLIEPMQLNIIFHLYKVASPKVRKVVKVTLLGNLQGHK